eukprot:gnl/MRDRNA2_/MRDRNA2_86459_c0_seq1.p1 gnl/MRDRNA2_/MRDRNA2_86459_c0~~gnl/MRDRNA2_/MRDRNA2_86459_c0_seq1.p1  ORF type:complete len:473 (-),score=108.84 gnl/MRDRNA2_/MRDRNA2_86459_c0_seq1:180-1523(-)
MAISMILRQSDRQVVQQHVETIRSEAQVTADELKLAESKLAAQNDEVSKLHAEVVQLREECAEVLQASHGQNHASQAAVELLEVEELQDKASAQRKLVARTKEVLQLRKQLAGLHGFEDQLRTEFAEELAKRQEETKLAIRHAEQAAIHKAAKYQKEAELACRRANEESARAAEAESIMVAMNIEAESLNKDLTTAAEANATLRAELSAASAVAGTCPWTWKDLEGVWLSEPGQEIQWIDGTAGGVWSKECQWAKIVEYAGGFALLANGYSTCRGELLQSARGFVLLWPGRGAWVKQSMSAIRDAWEVGSVELYCPASHQLRWVTTPSSHSSKHLSSGSKSCKRWDTATQMLSACSACNFPVASTEAGMWQCRSCRYNVCGSCAVASAPLNREAGEVLPFEVLPDQNCTCSSCGGICRSGKAAIGYDGKNSNRYLCLSCVGIFLTQT